MAQLDVTEILNDPMLVSTFGVIRAGQIVGNDGRASAANNNPKQIYGVVTPASARSLEMLPDMTNVHGSIEIYTKFRLEGPSRTTQPDTIQWQDNIYTVVSVRSYTNYGRGFTVAVCQLKDLLAASPNRTVIDRGP